MEGSKRKAGEDGVFVKASLGIFLSTRVFLPENCMSGEIGSIRLRNSFVFFPFLK